MEGAANTESETLRRSARENKGVKPARLGFSGVPGGGTNPKTTGSVKTTSSAAQKAAIEAEKIRRVTDARKEVATRKKEVTSLKAKLDSSNKKLKLLETPEGAESTEAADKRRKAIKNLQMEIINLEEKLTEANSALDFAAETLPDEEKAIVAECDAQMEAVESDYESVGDLSIPEEDKKEKEARVDTWAKNTVSGNLDQGNENVNTNIAMNRSTVTQDGQILSSQTVIPVPPGALVSTPRVHFPETSMENNTDIHTPGPNPGSNNPSPSQDTLIERMVSAMERIGSTGRQEVTVKTAVDKKLPMFDGNPGKWLNFFSEYERTTKKYNFDNSENLCRLSDSLSGEALKVVRHLMGNPLNLEKVISTLKKRFGRPEYVLDYMVEEVKNTKPPDPSDPKTMVDFGTALDALVTNINSYEKLEYLSSTHLVAELVKKLPIALRNQWYEWIVINESEAKLEDFAKWVDIKASAALMGLKPKVTGTKNVEEKNLRPKRGPGSVNATAVDKTDSSRSPCPLCKTKFHTLDKCWSFPKQAIQDRWRIVKEASPSLCISCLKKGHRSRNCPDKKPCTYSNCKYQHHPLFHTDEMEKTEEKSVAGEDGSADSSGQPVQPGSINVTIMNKEAIVKGCDGPLPIIPVIIRGPFGTKKTYALLDTGASRSLISQDVADSIGLQGEQYPYQFTSVSGNQSTEMDSQLVDAQIAGTYHNAKFLPLRRAVTVANIKMSPYSFKTKEVRKQWPHLQRVRGENLVNVIPQIIIGNNNPVLILAKEILSGGDDAPIGWRTPLGWTISGDVDSFSGNRHGSVNHIGIQPITNEYLHDLIKSSFTTDNFGVVPSTRTGKNIMEEKSYEIMRATTKKTGDRWETGLLWKNPSVLLPESESMAFKRLLGVEKKMKDDQFANLYRGKFQEYQDKGYLKKLTTGEANHQDARTWYIPHFGVTNVNKPGKLRFVLDAAAKSNDVCLNDMLMKGPDLIRPLTSVLWNFRLHKVAITGDIADMFHRVLVRPEDRNSQRLLWRDGNLSRRPDHYEMHVLIFGATSSPSSAIYVKNVNAEEFQEKYPEAVRAIVEDHYVDDCLSGARTNEDAVKLREEITMINAAGGFVERRWMSNSPAVIESIPEDYRADGAKNFNDKSELPTERVLGMWWDPNLDIFTFKLALHKVPKEIVEGNRPTKRQVCSLVMSLFDPMGFISHYKIKGIMILQRIWRSEIDWDEEIPSNEFQDRTNWLDRIHEITHVKVPRFYSDHVYQRTGVELHTFVDASEEAFAAVCYLRFSDGENVQVSLFGAKARVAPLKKLTIPRLELQAALLGSRLAQTIGQELRLKLSARYFWSDSRTVLSWIRSEAGKFKEFVANRVGEIQEITDSFEWKWVPTDLNVADIATRYAGEISFQPEDRWFTGPGFLKLDSSQWPPERKHEQNVVVAATCGKDLEVDLAINPKSISSVLDNDMSLPKINNFSSYNRLVRASAMVYKAAQLFQNGSSLPETQLLENAETRLIKFVQIEAFPEEIKIAQSGKSIMKYCRQSKIARLSPTLRNGILCVQGRIERAAVSDGAKFPIILPSRHHFTDLLIDQEHKRCGHQGRETVLNNLRQKFWIVDGRQAVIRAFKRCGECRIRKARPLIPVMGVLPSYRLAAYQPPFFFTGLDFFGPIEVTVGRRHEKRWGALFCCLVSRGVHLEIAHGLSTDEAMMCLSRFMDTRGRPSVIYSDNGTNFVGANKELKREQAKMDFNAISCNGKFQSIEWRFNPPAAPHFGGAWERLVKSVKKCLSSILHQKYPRDSTLLTALKSVEGILNSRPLTHVSGDPDDSLALTPNHFLRGGCDAGPSIPADMDPSDDYLRAQWKRAQLLADQFWTRWIKEYLPKLLVRDKWRSPTEPIQTGDLVFMVDENQPRNTWIKGYISKVFRGADGQVRVVNVITKDVDGKKKEYRRPVAKVCPIGVKMEIQED